MTTLSKIKSDHCNRFPTTVDRKRSTNMFNLFDPVGSKKPIHWTYTNSCTFALKVLVRQTVFGIKKAEILFVMCSVMTLFREVFSTTTTTATKTTLFDQQQQQRPIPIRCLFVETTTNQGRLRASSALMIINGYKTWSESS